ncbi:MAG: pyruvate kinase [Bdellovibrionota bacterium]
MTECKADCDCCSCSNEQVFRKTKIVATLGPASSSEEMIEKLIKAGVNVFRQNFSHGSYEEHGALLERVRNVSERLKVPVAVLQDLSGPKIRITELDGEEFPELKNGHKIQIKHSKTEKSSVDTLYVGVFDPSLVLQKTNRVLLADGIIELEVVDVVDGVVSCVVTRGGKLRSRVGIIFPDNVIPLPATTEKDIEDLKWGLERNFDYVALSFVQTPEDVKRIKDYIKSKNSKLKVISKIECKTSLKKIDEILEVTDGIMVARGDLGVEIPMERLPVVQKELIAKANILGKPVIVATQMLHSMVTNIRPTRAEVTDVANAIFDGADAVMLSEETAIGNNPEEAVGYLRKVALEIEPYLSEEGYLEKIENEEREAVQDSIAYAACAAADKVQAKALIVSSDTGRTTRLIAKYRPAQTLFGVTATKLTLRQMCLLFGVQPVFIDTLEEGSPVPLKVAVDRVREILKPEVGDIAVCTRAINVEGSDDRRSTAVQIIPF